MTDEQPTREQRAKSPVCLGCGSQGTLENVHTGTRWCDACDMSFGWDAVIIEAVDEGDARRLPTVEVTVPREMVDGEPTADAMARARPSARTIVAYPHTDEQATRVIARAIDESLREEHSNRGEVMAACILAHRNGWTPSAIDRLKGAVEQLIARDEP